MTTSYPKILAFDYGTQRIGVAVSRGSLAEPLLILENDNAVWQKIIQLCQDEQIERIVVGLSEGAMADMSQQFGEVVQEKTGIPVVFWDETLSSHAVNRRLAEAHKITPVRKNIDHYAAAVILEEWLESH